MLARAGDAGPPRDIRAIERALPVLAARRLERDGIAGSSLRIESVVVTGDEARVLWRVDGPKPLVQMERMIYRYDRWWVAQNSSLSSDGGSAACCRVRFADRAFQLETSNMGGYGMTLHFAANDAPEDAAIRDITGRPPTEAESWMTPGGNSYFFFSGTVQAQQPIHVQAGTTIDVWFPFVLDTSLRYSLTLASPGTMSIGPLDGVLKDNTLHFVLPAFAATPGADLMGEIESD